MKKQQEIRLPYYKVNTFKRYSLRLIITSILSFAMIGLCIAMLFLPIATFSTVVSESTIDYSFKGMDLIVDFFKGSDDSYIGLLNYVGKLTKYSIEPGILRNILNVFFLVTPMLFLVIAFHAVFLAIFAFKGLIYGKLSNYKGPTSFARAIGFCILLISGFIVAFNFLLPGFTKNNVSLSKDIFYSYIYLSVEIVLWVSLHSIYYLGFKHFYFEGDVKKVEDDAPTIISSYAPIETEKKSNTNSIPTINQEVSKKPESSEPQQSIGLPSNIKNIGGHAFTANMNLRLAVIPEGIPSIGDGAFANCGNLTLVSIPKSMKSIGANAFFNCQNLKRINYGGTKIEWSKIARGSNWLLEAGTNIVVCVDGTIVVDPVS